MTRAVEVSAEKASATKSVVATQATTEEGEVVRAGLEDAATRSPRARRPRATAEAESIARRAAAPEKGGRAEKMRAYWREVKAGRRPRLNQRHEPPRGADFNPLLALPDEQRAKLFVFLRDCPYNDAARVLLREQGLNEVTDAQITEFHQEEAYHHWEVRTSRAADEADALIRLAENSVPTFSSAILAALGQEAFRQIARGAADPGAMSKLVTLFMKARGEERTDQMQELKREKLQHELQGKVEHALGKFAEEVERYPAAREAFAELRRELAANAEDKV